MTRRGAILAAAALAVVGSVVPSGSLSQATAAPAASCSTSKGVLVVVDFRHFGGNISRGCDPSPSTGRNALDAAGFNTVDVQRQPGFVCRINGDPSDDPCINTPPAASYWSYWHAGKGQNSWTYSKVGASSSHPGNGSTDAWVFGATDTSGSNGGPCFSPADARAGRATGCAAKPAPRPKSSSAKPHSKAVSHAHHSRASSSGSASTTTTVRAGSTTSAASTSSASRRASSSASASPTTQSSTATSTTSASEGGKGAPTIVDATPASASAHSGSGSALPLVLAAALIVVFGAGAGWTAWRRRRTGTDG